MLCDFVAEQAHLRRLTTGHLPAAAAHAVAASTAGEAAVLGDSSAGLVQVRAASSTSSRQPSPGTRSATEAAAIPAAAAAAAAAARTRDPVGRLDRSGHSASVRCAFLIFCPGLGHFCVGHDASSFMKVLLPSMYGIAKAVL